MMNNASSISTLARASNAVLTLVLGTLVLAAVQIAHADPLAAGAPVTAANNVMGKISVVDIDYLIANSKAGKSIRVQLDKQRDNYRSQIEKQEAALDKSKQNLIAEQNTLSKEDFLQKRKVFDQQVETAQRGVQLRQKDFYDAHAAALEKLRENIVRIVADTAGKNNIALVLNRQEVVLVDAKMDITKDILAKLDAAITSIPVTVK